jgi:hypothetical protein
MPAPLVNLGPYQTAKTHTWGIGQSWRWPDFSPFELRQRNDGVVVIDPSFLDRLPRTTGPRSTTPRSRVRGAPVLTPRAARWTLPSAVSILLL